MASTPKKSGAADAKKSGGGIERFLVKKPPNGSTGTRNIGAVDAKKKSSDGGIEQFSIRKRPPSDHGTAQNPSKSSAVDAKKKSSDGGIIEQFSIRKRPPSEDWTTVESPSKRELFPVSKKGRVYAASEKQKTTQRQKSMQALGFTVTKIPKHMPPPKISFFVTDEMKEMVEQSIAQSLFERDAITVPTNQIQSSLSGVVPLPTNNLIQPSVSIVPLNAEQQRVIECPPNIPLSVRACAGTGKTHTMVQRAISFINTHGIDPRNILIITFSKLATEEVIDRVTRAFGRETDLPTIKTFHALAYSWVCRSWKCCGLGQRPSVLNPKSGEMALMKQVFEVIVDNERLERCVRKLKLEEESSS
jgi:hypothetical protein